MAMINVAEPQTAPRVRGSERAVLARPAQLVYDGRLGALWALWLKTLLLTVLTLGFYRFWGRTRIRKYLWSRVSLDGDRFEYDGTGGELFWRFLLALIVLAPLALGPLIAEVMGIDQLIVASLRAAQVVLFGWLALLGYYAGRRYRLSRTVWRGIRGGLEGSAAHYGLKAAWAWFLTVVTIGFYFPWLRVKLWRYEADHTRAGDEHFRFSGARGRHLIGGWLGSLAIFVVASLAIGALGVAVFSAMDEELGLVRFLPLALISAIFLLWPITLARFNARWWSYMVKRTLIRDVRLGAHIGTWPLLKLQLGNALLMLLTFGLGWAFVGHRVLKFWCTHLEIAGLESLESLTQSTPPPKAGAEGLAQMLGDGGFA